LLSIRLNMNDETEKQKIRSWLCDEFPDGCRFIEGSDNEEQANIIIIEIQTLFDWVRIRRLQKNNNRCMIFPLLTPDWIHTSPLAIELNVQSMFIKPLKKNYFLRNIKKVMNKVKTSSFSYSEVYEQLQEEGTFNEEDAPFQEAFLRRLLRGEISSEQEVIQARSFLAGHAIPNVVVFIQGFVSDPEKEKAEGWEAPSIIIDSLRKEFSKCTPHVSFLSYRKHLLLLMRVPVNYTSIKHWKNGEQALLNVIEQLKNTYGIYLYIGVGSIYREALHLHHSYREARKARRTPPFNRIHLRYFDDITKNEQLKKVFEYIQLHFNQEILVSEAAARANFSPTYFSRQFKKETGRSFVEYVTFVRLQRAIWLIRHTNDTIEQISDEIGFNTPNYFSAIFKKYVGLSPSEYRATREILFI
jgi:two-component system response regulator YesN